MAAYASTLTLTSGPRIQRLTRDLGIVTGTLNITNYNSTNSVESTLTRLFKPATGATMGVLVCVFEVSANGYVLDFDKSTGKVKVWHGDNNNAADGPLVEAANDVAVGAADFIAIGYMAA